MNVQAVNNFRENLRLAMEAEGITQRDLSRESGITLAYINRLLVGKADHPSVTVLESLSNAVNRPLADLISDPKFFRRNLKIAAHAG